MLKIKYFIQQSWLLILASFCFGLLLAATNYALSPIIAQNKIDKLNRKAGALLPAAGHFVELEEKIEIKSVRGRPEEIVAYKGISADEKIAGWAFNIKGSGFADKIEMVIVVDKDFQTLAGYGVLSSNETPGFGDQIKYDYFRNQFKGAPAGELELVLRGDASEIDSQIVAITGATISSEAVVEIISNSLTRIKEQMQKNGLIGNGK